MIKNAFTPFSFVVAVFLLLATAAYGAILYLNQGTFIFSLDDPYIHLAVAENLWQGHYGVNLQEYSAPSSSILWAVIIAPFTLFVGGDSLLLALNLVFSFLTLWQFQQLLCLAEKQRQQAISFAWQLVLLLAFVVFANLLGLAFLGMEHSLQLWLSMTLLVGLLRQAQDEKPHWSLYLCVVLLPLIRFETAVLSAAALLFLFARRYYWQSLLTGAVLLACVVTFSLFLLSLGLGYLPDSVLAKSDVASNGFYRLLANFKQNIQTSSPPMMKGLVLLIIASYLLWQVKTLSQPALRLLAVVLALAILLHLLGGRIGWFWRYELYIWAVSLSFLIYLQLLQANKPRLVFLAALFFVSLEHLAAYALTPLASSNIYLQQYQMHRLITEFYQKPVAVNDLGWTSYHNPHYVLDLWGLGSSQAREMRKNGSNKAWLEQLVAEQGIELVMIYHHPKWFEEVPDSWIKLGELDSDRFRIVSLMPVSLFTPCQSCVIELQQTLGQFAESLPEGAFYQTSTP